MRRAASIAHSSCCAKAKRRGRAALAEILDRDAGARDAVRGGRSRENLGAIAYLNDTAKAIAASGDQLDPTTLGRGFSSAACISERAAWPLPSRRLEGREAAERAGNERDVWRRALGTSAPGNEPRRVRPPPPRRTRATPDCGSASSRSSFGKMGDVQSLHGVIWRRRSGPIRTACAGAERPAAQDDRLGSATSRSATSRIGDVLECARAISAAALDAYRHSLAIAEKLASARSGQRRVAARPLGQLQQDRRRAERAGRSRRRAQGLSGRASPSPRSWPAQDPSNAEWQRDLSVSFDRIGDVQRARGNLDGRAQGLRGQPRHRREAGRAGPEQRRLAARCLGLHVALAKRRWRRSWRRFWRWKPEALGAAGRAAPQQARAQPRRSWPHHLRASSAMRRAALTDDKSLMGWRALRSTPMITRQFC